MKNLSLRSKTSANVKKLMAAALLTTIPLSSSLVSTTPAEASVPSCVVIASQGRSSGTSYATIKNQCGSTQRVRVNWGNAYDSSCVSFNYGFITRRTAGFWGTPYVKGLMSC